MTALKLLKVISKHAAIHLCLAALFVACWGMHYMAFVRMEACDRQFLLMNDKTLRCMALIDFVAANYGWTVGYAGLIVAAVAFLQVRRHAAWTWWVTAGVLCVPCLLYWKACFYIQGKLLFY